MVINTSQPEKKFQLHKNVNIFHLNNLKNQYKQLSEYNWNRMPWMRAIMGGIKALKNLNHSYAFKKFEILLL